MGESMYLYPTVNDKWSRQLLYYVANELQLACAESGFTIDGTPKLHVVPRYNLPGWLARNYSTFSMILESTENYYPLEDNVRSGLVRLSRLLEISEKYNNFQVYQNYPCDLISGNYMGALLSYGNDYEKRRKSRKAMTQMILEGVPRFGRKACDHHWQAVIELPLNKEVNTLPEGLTFRATLDRRAEVKSVFWGDQCLEDHLWNLDKINMGMIVTANIPESPKIGLNQLKINYETPFKRHVTL